MPCVPFAGEYRVTGNAGGEEDLDIFEVLALAKRMNFSLAELKELSFCNLINILLSQVAPEERTAKQSDIDAFLR